MHTFNLTQKIEGLEKDILETKRKINKVSERIEKAIIKQIELSHEHSHNIVTQLLIDLEKQVSREECERLIKELDLEYHFGISGR